MDVTMNNDAAKMPRRTESAFQIVRTPKLVGADTT